MSIDRLRYFAAVVETKNLRQAADLVGIAPPSMSKAIAVLEDELGCKLIHPEGRGIGITAKGLDVYRNMAPLLQEYRDFHQRVRTSAKKSEKLRIATFEVFSSYFLSSFFAEHRELDALLLELAPGRIEQAILAGSVDAGLTYIPSPDPALEYVEIGSFQMAIFGTEKWHSKPFQEWPFALPTTELRIHSSEIDAMDVWPKDAPKRRVKFEFELLETALQTSRRGLSVLHCPDFIVKLHNEDLKATYQLRKLSAPAGYKAPKPIKAYLVRRKGSSATINLEGKLAKFMRSLA